MIQIRLFENLNKGGMIFALILMAQFLLWDAAITHVFAGGGIVKEANPLVSAAVYSGDFLVIKLLSLLVMVPGLLILHRFYPRVAFTTTACVAMFYVGVVAWNFLVLFSNIA